MPDHISSRYHRIKGKDFMTGKKPSLSSNVYEALKRDIIRCILPPGKSLHESELAAKYKVSKTPVREALNALRLEGYVSVEARRGYSVSQISLKDIQEVFDLRLIVEPRAAFKAAKRLQEADLKKLKDLAVLKYVHGDLESYGKFLLDNRQFHVGVARASGNQRLADLVDRLLEEMERFFHLGIDLRDPSGKVSHEHTDLIHALEAGDSKKAERVMSDQIMAFRKRLIEALVNHVDSGANAVSVS